MAWEKRKERKLLWRSNMDLGNRNCRDIPWYLV